MSVKVVVPERIISAAASRVPHFTKSAETFLASAGKMKWVSQSMRSRSSAMPRKSVFAACVCVLTKPGRTALPRASMVAFPANCLAMSARLPTPTITPWSIATAPSSISGPAMVRTVPPVTRRSTFFGAARRGTAKRKRMKTNALRALIRGALSLAPRQLSFDVRPGHALVHHQRLEVIDQIGNLRHQPLARFMRRGDDDLRRLLVHLLQDLGAPGVEERRRVRPLRPLREARLQRGVELVERAQRHVREARTRAGVTRRSVRNHADDERIAIAVGGDVHDVLRVPRGRALVPQLVARARPEPRLARLLRPPQRLLVHVRQGQYLARARVAHDRRDQAIGEFHVHRRTGIPSPSR